MDVYLNIYDFLSMNKRLQKLGIGVYHTGVEIDGIEYCYCVVDSDPNVGGIVEVLPQSAGYTFSRKAYMGQTSCTSLELTRIIWQMARKFTCGQYNIFSNNCNHFSDQLIRRLTGRSLDPCMFRMTNFLKCACFCLPKKLVSGQWQLQRIRRAEEEQELIQIRDNIRSP